MLNRNAHFNLNFYSISEVLCSVLKNWDTKQSRDTDMQTCLKAWFLHCIWQQGYSTCPTPTNNKGMNCVHIISKNIIHIHFSCNVTFYWNVCVSKYLNLWNCGCSFIFAMKTDDINEMTFICMFSFWCHILCRYWWRSISKIKSIIHTPIADELPFVTNNFGTLMHCNFFVCLCLSNKLVGGDPPTLSCKGKPVLYSANFDEVNLKSLYLAPYHFETYTTLKCLTTDDIPQHEPLSNVKAVLCNCH